MKKLIARFRTLDEFEEKEVRVYADVHLSP
jgi:hypothetical protein